MASLSYAPSMRGVDREYDIREHISVRGGTGAGQLIPRAPTVVEEPIVEHEHHHLHHHIDHGDVNSRLGISRRPEIPRQYSYDDLDVHERRYANGSTVSTIHRAHEHEHRRRHRHRHRSGRTEVERRSYSRSDLDLDRVGREYDDVTVIDVAPGSKRVYVNVQEAGSRRERDREEVDWRREHGIRRSRGLGNELWTEITKDLITREAIEELGYAYEETEYFYYIFEYLNSDEIAELRELTDDIRHDRVRDLQWNSIAGSQAGDISRRMISSGRSERGRDFVDVDDSRTEIVIESSRSAGGRSRRNKYYY